MRISDWSSDVCSSDLVHDIEFDLLERRGDLVLDDLHPRRIADDIVAILDLAGAADVEPDGSIEFERVAAGGRFGIAVHHADLNAERSEEQTSELQSLMRISYAVFCLKKKKRQLKK